MVPSSRQRVAVAVAVCFSLSACFFNEGPWPAEGTGGLAEYLPITNQRLEDLNDRLEVARNHNAAKYAAAAFGDASILMARCRREFAAGLYLDAQADMDQLQREVDEVERTLGISPSRGVS